MEQRLGRQCGGAGGDIRGSLSALFQIMGRLAEPLGE